MPHLDTHLALTRLFGELTEGASTGGGAFILNSGDAGLLASLDALTASDASESLSNGATVAAHARHLQYGLSLMNRWSLNRGDPFADATWDLAWQTREVTEAEWSDIRARLRDEVVQWTRALGEVREVSAIELTGMMASIAHLAYHLGAIRQIAGGARGPREGTFS